MSKMVTREISLQEKWEGLQAISSFKTTRSILNFDVFWSLIESHNPDVFFRGKWCGLINTKVSWVNLTGLCKINGVGSCAVSSKALSGITLRQSIVAQNYSIFKGKKYFLRKVKVNVRRHCWLKLIHTNILRHQAAVGHGNDSATLSSIWSRACYKSL